MGKQEHGQIRGSPKEGMLALGVTKYGAVEAIRGDMG